MKTLSAANQTNIKQRKQTPEILVTLSGLSLQFAVGLTDGYEPEVRSISPITMEYDPYVGLGSWSDVTIELSLKRAGSQIMVANELRMEAVAIVVKYGTDADIPAWAGNVDSWGYSAGIITLNCVTQADLSGHNLPIQQINSTNFSTYTIPPFNNGRWVPFTIGTPYRPLALLNSYGGGTVAQAIVNAPVTGHAGIGSITVDPGFYLHDPGERDYLVSAGSQVTSTDVTKGEIKFADTDEFILERMVTPIDAEWKTGGSYVAGTDPLNAIDGDDATFALLNDPADAATKTGILLLRLPEIGISPGFKCKTFYFVGKVTKLLAMNDGARTAEEMDAALEVVEGTVATGLQLLQIIADSQTSLDNLPESINRQFLTLQYTASLGDDIGGLDVGISPAKLSRKIMEIRCTEEDTGSDADYFRIYEAKLWMWLYAGLNTTSIHPVISGYDDDGSGTYTGGANGLIETPSDVVHFILAELWALTGYNAASITATRSDYSAYILAGQILNPEDAESILQRMVFESRMILYRDASGDWKQKMWNLPGAADKTFDQAAGEFYSDDNGEGEIEQITTTPSEKIYNQFDLEYEWDEGNQKYNKVLHLDESTAGARGTWLTSSQSVNNITRRRTYGAKWITDDDTATSFGNFLIYRDADQHRMVRFSTWFNGLEMELGDIVTLTHTDITAAGAGSDKFEITGIETDLMNGKITFTGFQADATASALDDPTQP